MWRRLLVVVVTLLAAQGLAAQTPTFRLGWDQAEPVAAVQTFKYTLKVDNGGPVNIAPTCVAKAPSGTSCTFLLSTTGVTYLLTAWNGFGSAAADPLTGLPPSKPTGVTVTVTVTIVASP